MKHLKIPSPEERLAFHRALRNILRLLPHANTLEGLGRLLASLQTETSGMAQVCGITASDLSAFRQGWKAGKSTEWTTEIPPAKTPHKAVTRAVMQHLKSHDTIDADDLRKKRSLKSCSRATLISMLHQLKSDGVLIELSPGVPGPGGKPAVYTLARRQ